MNCLIDFIGVDYCNADAPESGIVINDLPGISMQVLSKIADSEKVTFLEVWASAQRRATRRLKTAVTNELGKRYKLNQLLESVVLKKEVESDTLAADDEYRGITIELPDGASLLQVIHVQELYLYRSSGSGSVTIKIYELTGEDDSAAYEVHSETVSTTAGWNRIAVNTNFFDCNKLFIGTDCSSFTTNDLLLDSNDAQDNYCGGLTIKGAKSDKPFANLTEGLNTYGLTGVFSVRCMLEQFVCNNKSAFGTALWYLCGAEVMAERCATDRLNRYTTIDIGKAKELRTEYESKFSHELSSVIEGVNLNMLDWCLDCNGHIKTVEARP